MRSYRVGNVSGIPLKLDLTFLLVLPLLTFVIGTEVPTWVGILDSQFATSIRQEPLSGPVIPFVIGLFGAIGLFTSVLLHELGHSLVARHYGHPISSITLWLFGGLVRMRAHPQEWQQELSVAVAGPLVSVGLGVGLLGVFRALSVLVPPGGDPVSITIVFLVGYLGVTNLGLAAFNLLPGFPMDGGRILRAVLSINRPYPRATHIATEIGKLFAVGLGLVGLFVGFNVFLVAIAFFIYLGATSEAQQTTINAAFDGLTVRDIMTPKECVDSVDPDLSVGKLLEYVFEERHTGYPVLRDGELVGLVTLDDTAQVVKSEYDTRLVSAVMETDPQTLAAQTTAREALKTMQEKQSQHVLVVEDGFAGLLTQADLLAALSIIRTHGSLPRSDTEPALTR